MAEACELPRRRGDDECDRTSRGRNNLRCERHDDCSGDTESEDVGVSKPDQRRECVRIEGAAVRREHEPVGEQRQHDIDHTRGDAEAISRDPAADDRSRDNGDRREHECHHDRRSAAGRLRRRDERDDDDRRHGERGDRYALTAEELRYHAIVRSSPSRSEVPASNPNSSRAREASRLRRGWPFGIDVSQTISPSNPVSSAIVSASSRIEISTPVPMLTGSAPS